jgi:hypothetical protein
MEIVAKFSEKIKFLFILLILFQVQVMDLRKIIKNYFDSSHKIFD